MAAKIPKAFRLSVEAEADLLYISPDYGSQNAAIEALIVQAAQAKRHAAQQAALGQLPEIYGWSEPRPALVSLQCSECEMPITVGQAYCKADMSDNSNWFAHVGCADLDDL